MTMSAGGSCAAAATSPDAATIASAMRATRFMNFASAIT
jgi:hypothetical protein